MEEELKFTGKQLIQTKVASESIPLDYDLSGNHLLNPSVYVQTFRRSNISYKPDSKSHQFSFEVERMFPSLDFYKIKVQIAHFSLTLTAARYPCFPLTSQTEADIRGNFGAINFLKLGQKTLCLKSFNFKTHAEFQIIFPAVVKELTILYICSAIECAPKRADSLGFDLLIFDGCIQYATEKGQAISEISLQDAKSLREQLALLHLFKIMHLDIKPENIVFSKSLGKPVFIDFGFSEIIEQDFGFKTLTIFKGTPNFCCPQMLALMTEDDGYIDLYYNDALCLMKTINLTKKALSQLFEEQHIIYAHFLIKENTALAVSDYFMYAFQYYYLQQNLLKARQALQLSLINNESNAKKVLIFIKITAHWIFIPQIAQNDLRKYSCMIEYREMQEHLRRNTGVIFNQNNLSDIDSQTDNRPMFELSSFLGNYELDQSFQHYLSILLGLGQLEDKTATNFVAIAFQCVRFDVRNLEVSEKKQIADKMNALLLKHLQKNIEQFTVFQKGNSKELHVDQEREMLKPIKLLLLLIFEFCLARRPQQSKWVKKRIFNICQQMILVDACFLQCIDKLNEYVKKNFTNPLQKALVMFEYSRLFDTVNIVNTLHTETIDSIQSTLKTLSVDYKGQFFECPSQTQKVGPIQQILRMLEQNMPNKDKHVFEKQEMKVMSIQHSQIRKYLTLYLTTKKIDHYFGIMCPEQVFKTKQFVRRSIDLQSLDFISLYILIKKILIGIYNQTEFNAYCKHISNVINCPTIYDSLLIRQRQQIHKSDIDIVKDRIDKIYQRHAHSFQYQSFKYEVFHLLVLIEKREISVDLNTKQQFIRLYERYKKQMLIGPINQSPFDQIEIQLFTNRYFYTKIEYFFFELSPNTQGVFLRNLSIAQEYYQQMAAKQRATLSIPQTYNFVLSVFNKNVYWVQYYTYLKDYQACLVCLNQLRLLLTNLKLSSLLLEILRVQINMVALRCKRMDLIEKSVHNLYNFCCQIDYKGFFLFPSSKTQLYVTLTSFQVSSPALFYTLISQLMSFLQSHPVEQYFQSFMFALDTFLAHNGSKGHAIHYTKFLEGKGKSKVRQNPYYLIFYAYSLLNQDKQTQLKLFKIIVVHSQRLMSYAKRKILEKGFEVYFSHQKSNKIRQALYIFRKVKYFIGQRKRKQIIRNIISIKNQNSAQLKKYKRFISYLS